MYYVSYYVRANSNPLRVAYYVRARELKPVARCASCRVERFHVRVVACRRVDSVFVVVVDRASSLDDG